MFTVVDRQQWNTRRVAEPPLSPELQQMFALARRIGYEMRPIARRLDAPRQTPGPQSSPNKEYRTPFRPRDYSRTKCFSCGQLGHTQVRCPKPDSSLPFRTGGSIGQMDHSDVMEDPHRETKYRPGPNPHWPVCHRFGLRFSRILSRFGIFSDSHVGYILSDSGTCGRSIRHSPIHSEDATQRKWYWH